MSPKRNPMPHTRTSRLPHLAWRLCLACLLAAACLPLALPTLARDLDAVSDGEHLWLVEPGATDTQTEDSDADAKPQLQIYHSSADTQPGQIIAIDEAINGQLMQRGLAAGDGLLLMVLDDRQVITLSPRWSSLMDRWVYSRQSLPQLPEGCALLGITISDAGPWALVRVESPELLAKLDQTGQTRQSDRAMDAVMRNRALDLPDDYVLPNSLRPRGATQPETEPEPEIELDNESENEGVINGENANDPDAEQDAEVAASPQEAAAPQLPVYRLIHIQRGQWVSSPLPDDFVEPRFVMLLQRNSDDRPTVIVEPNTPAIPAGELVLYRPVTLVDALPTQEDAQADAPDPLPWTQSRIDPRPYPGKLWSAQLVEGQVVLAVELSRSSTSIAVELHHLRTSGGSESGIVGAIELPTADSGRWAVIPWREDLGLIARPAQAVQSDTPDEPAAVGEPFAILSAMTLQGQAVILKQPDATTLTLYLTQQDTVTGNADLYIQIGTFVIAMVMMLLFYKRAVRTDELDLPDGLVLASFGKRIIAGAIDLAPGFWLAGTIYELSISDTLLYWPGNGVAKVLAAMLPGFVVIGVTLAHTTVCEILFTRSLGKLITGLAVADEHGKRAKPINVLLRSLSKLFELFAPLMLILAIISPARQRLGDVLARTIVVTRKAETPNDKPDDDKP